MGVYRRSDSPYWWFWLEPPDGGKPKAESSKVRVDAPTPELRKSNRALAEQKYHQRLFAFSRDAAGLGPKPPIAFDQYADWYEVNVCSTHGCYARERSSLKQFRAYFESAPLARIDKERVLEWRTARVRKVCPATADRDLDVLKSLFVSAVPKYLTVSPIAGLKRHRDTTQATKRRPRILTPDEEVRVLKAATEARDRALIVLAIDTLMRLSDVKELRRDRDYGTTIHVEAPKIQPYDVPVSKRLRKALDALPAADGAFYFPRRWAGREGGISVNTVWRIFRKLCKAANVPVGRKTRGVTFHSLRHTGTTRMLEAGVNPVAVMEIGGWHGLRQLSRYGHSSEETKRRAVDLIAPQRTPRAGKPASSPKAP